MSGARLFATLALLLCIAAPSGCCERKGYILRGDFALELNRVSHLLGRHDDYELCPGECDCGECQAMDSWGNGGGSALDGPEPRLHPVPTRPVFAPDRPTPAKPMDATSPSEAPTSRRSNATSQRRVAGLGKLTPRGAASPQSSGRRAAMPATYATGPSRPAKPRYVP